MSTSWQASLRQALNPPERAEALRLAVVGIGHELRGDDAVGLLIVRDLQRTLISRERLLVLEGGTAPENVTGPLRRFGPDLVILIDAAYMGAEPGAVCWVKWQDTTGLSASTHTTPPYLISRYLTAELGCEVALLGIEPAQMALGTPVSEPVLAAVELVCLAFVDSLR